MAKVYVSSFIDDWGDIKYGLAYMYQGKEYYVRENGRELVYNFLEEANSKFQSLLDERVREDNTKPFTKEQAYEFVNSCRWTFATTYAKTAPHEYLIKARLSPYSRLDFERFVALIKRDAEELDSVEVSEVPVEEIEEEVAEARPQIKYYRCRCPKCGYLEFRKANEVEAGNE